MSGKDQIIAVLPTEQAINPDGPEQRRIIEERNRWFYSLNVPRKQEKLFELEVYLKGLDRFFNIANLPISERESIVGRDFTPELIIIRNAVAKVVKLSKGLLSAEDNRALHFTSYVENRLMSDYQRAKMIERTLLQRTPEESLYVLCHTFINFQEILQSIVRQTRKSFFLFYNLEQLISREISGNRHFNPFKAAGFAPHYDVIKSPRFVRLARSISDPVLKKHLSIVFLMMFKLLRYLSFINPETKDLETLRDTLIIFSLIHSEAMFLADLLEKELPPVIRARSGVPQEMRAKLLENMDALSYQTSVEFKKIFELELKDAAHIKDVNQLRTGISRSRGLLSNIFQQSIVSMGQALDPELDGKEVFPDFVSRMEESLKLRRDVWLFHRVVENLENVIEVSQQKGETIPLIEAIKTLRNFIFYYQNISFQYVRSLDRDEFKRFFDVVDRFVVKDVEVPEKFESFKKELHVFKMFLETTLANINNRAELRDLPFGREEGERILSQFLS